MTFYPDFYVIQDESTKKMIDMGKQYKGLYYLLNLHVAFNRAAFFERVQKQHEGN